MRKGSTLMKNRHSLFLFTPLVFVLFASVFFLQNTPVGKEIESFFATPTFERLDAQAAEDSAAVSLKKEKAPKEGWHTTEEGTSYYSKRKRQRGWKQIEESWYHFSEAGLMSKGWLQDEQVYYLTGEGVRAEGWQRIEEELYYFAPGTGVMESGKWLEQEGRRYYLKADGKAARGLDTVEGTSYYFDENSGECLVDTSKPMIALTFDDGPSDKTEELLDYLKEKSIKSTFFLLGVSIPGHEDVLKKIHDGGHVIGSHSYNHPKFIYLTDEEIRWQIEETDRLISEVIGEKTEFFRSPYGLSDERVEKLLGKPTILWNIDSEDWHGKTANEIKDSLLADARDGAIVLMHDTYSTTIDAVKMAVPLLQEMGYQIVDMKTLFKAKGQTPEADGRYFNVP